MQSEQYLQAVDSSVSQAHCVITTCQLFVLMQSISTWQEQCAGVCGLAGVPLQSGLMTPVPHTAVRLASAAVCTGW